MQIVQYPHPALRYAAKPVREVTDEIRDIARQMIELMLGAGGIGLAANQVGLPIQLFVLNAENEAAQQIGQSVFINPQITERKGIIEEEEGCLSLPGLYAKLKRAAKIQLTALDQNGNPFQLTAEGLVSRAIQHEVDHLHGILFIDKLSPLVKLGIIGQVKEFERKYRQSQLAGEIPSDPEIRRQLSEQQAVHT